MYIEVFKWQNVRQKQNPEALKNTRTCAVAVQARYQKLVAVKNEKNS